MESILIKYLKEKNEINERLLIESMQLNKNLNYALQTEQKKIARIFNIDIKLKKIKINIGGTNIRCPNITKLRKLGFKPKINLDKGLEKIIVKL
jgi:nucleoside-diphosphate-sugar epimerase